MINRKSAENYCSEDISKIENYEQAISDKIQMWHCHHRLEVQGQFRNSKKLLLRCSMYYHVPAWQLIFLTPEDHQRIHHAGTHHSVETRSKMSTAKLGDKNPNFGKHETHPMFGTHRSDETKNKMSNTLRKHHWWNNGIITKHSKECPGEGWVRGRLNTPKSAT